ncbi:MAG: 16S rRNA (adenine(1518)-N(6)/adenine(1519)-N(6))-dimethyltransferase [Clostridiales bacterium GWB2_37_7]|nr:MAG: 16S rRNA (adenine(1518)-N(6)/adenine(1519)-N(6))-dimethyltransferase [Clostridiales bacterium GWB2_37_7]
MKNVINPSSTKELLKQFDFRMTKSLGQNFLIDKSILDKIIEGAELTKDDSVLEIGPGMGSMTQKLCESAAKVVAVEIDKKLLPVLKVTLEEYENVTVINGDILKLNLKDTLQEHFGDRKVKVVANLPYYITTPIIMKLLEEKLNLNSITIMVQKEVGDRIKAVPGGKEYGALSVAVQYYAKPSQVLLVPPHSFIPQPEVDSIVLKLDILSKPAVEVESESLFFRVVKASFGQRRKTLLNALTAGNLGLSKEQMKEVLNSVGVEESRRGETLSLQEFANIANKLYKYF